MIQLAINYSHDAASLYSQGRLTIDRFKTPDWPEMISEASRYCPVAVHFDLNAGNGKLNHTDWSRCEALLEQTRTPYFNLHLNPERADYPGFPVDTPDKRQFRLVVDYLYADVSAAVERLGPERVILENVPYRGQLEETLRPAVEPAVIRKIVLDTNCGFLLDLSHARISACYLGVNEYEYLSALPVNNLRELHFTGLSWVRGKLRDHLPARPCDWLMLEWVMDRIHAGDWPSPWLLAFEYGGVGEKFIGRSDPEIIAEQLPILRDMIIMA
jgi:uncharacterized protein (UPF0276 family)